ncbi:MAG: hypothetical protein H7Y19_09490 [Luteimonas sp.]|nr:hypothetical protein [Luteimonas sp.]
MITPPSRGDLRAVDGEVYNLLHSRVNVGDEIVLSAAFGDVVLEYTDRPVVLASAGIGITPMAGMLSHLVKSGSTRKVRLLHAGNSADSFLPRVNRLRTILRSCLTLRSPRGSLNLDNREIS